MLTRRTFLTGAAGTLSSALIQRFQWFTENEGYPLVVAPRNPTEHIYVSSEYEDLRLSLGKPVCAPEPPTWAGYFEEIWGVRQNHRSELLDACETWGLEPADLHEDCDIDTWLTYWGRNRSPEAAAYHLLEDLDVGPVLRGTAGEVGEIDFVNGPWPGNDYLGAHAVDDLSVSLLQHRLNELGTGIEIHVDADL